jgi:hypothetical protein
LFGVNNQLISEYHQYLDSKEAFLDSYIDSGSDHDLFIASYIHGHFSVIAANLLNAMNEPKNKNIKLTEWQEKTQLMLVNSIDKAIENNELASSDASDVLIMRKALFK